jgi:hypothetical protein
MSLTDEYFSEVFEQLDQLADDISRRNSRELDVLPALIQQACKRKCTQKSDHVIGATLHRSRGSVSATVSQKPAKDRSHFSQNNPDAEERSNLDLVGSITKLKVSTPIRRDSTPDGTIIPDLEGAPPHPEIELFSQQPSSRTASASLSSRMDSVSERATLDTVSLEATWSHWLWHETYSRYYKHRINAVGTQEVEWHEGGNQSEGYQQEGYQQDPYLRSRYHQIAYQPIGHLDSSPETWGSTRSGSSTSPLNVYGQLNSTTFSTSSASLSSATQYSASSLINGESTSQRSQTGLGLRHRADQSTSKGATDANPHLGLLYSSTVTFSGANLHL